MSLTICLMHGPQVLQESKPGTEAYLSYPHQYAAGDQLVVTVSKAPAYVWVQMDAALKPALLYLAAKQWAFTIPFNTEREWPYPDGAFLGRNHYAWARLATAAEISSERNWAENSHDQHAASGAFPHVTANAETRNEPAFYARNAIDGMVANEKHGNYPFQSWGIDNRDDAELALDFGRSVTVDHLALVLRADYPHDSYWTQVTAAFSDGSQETLSLEKTAAPQAFPITPRTVTGLRLIHLIKDQDSSTFPALTELAVWGHNA
ncbi:hypothetical protein [Schleiferilactobacillus shenzhenensis]|uniref:hypothetical protein n=1 Tax=Schleiferilactobacillus shenzhenensis TaxID=1231337 RepID=UPI00041C61F5|nr:hypothetical protein [Schleiferilactobacillus shenzhenensis]